MLRTSDEFTGYSLIQINDGEHLEVIPKGSVPGCPPITRKKKVLGLCITITKILKHSKVFFIKTNIIENLLGI